MDDFEMTRRIK